jgi:flagellar basal body-associated protein FliL
MREEKSKKSGLIIAVLFILLLVAVGYIVYVEIATRQAQKQLSIYQQGAEDGAQFGFEQAILQILQPALACQQVPLTFQEQTVNLVAVECIQGQAAQ